jgi:hypothetical protein
MWALVTREHDIVRPPSPDKPASDTGSLPLRRFGGTIGICPRTAHANSTGANQAIAPSMHAETMELKAIRACRKFA